MMASARVVSCPECDHPRTIKAQPRTRLRCPSCSAHFLAPGFDDVSASDGGPLPSLSAVAADPSAGVDLGPETVHIDAVSFRPAPVAPDGIGDEPELILADPDPPDAAEDDPTTVPAVSPAPADGGGPSASLPPPTIDDESPTPRRRRYGGGGW